MTHPIFRALPALALLGSAAPIAYGQKVAPTPSPTPVVREEIVVSATKGPEDPADVPASVSTVSGDELRRRGVRTIAEALQDVVGVDTGNGSDNGPRLANVGLWGLKEFDALLVTVDGVPVGGPFNPSLSQIPVEDIDRIEIVRGPQGTLYGVSAFAGMIQIFTRPAPSRGGTGSAALLGGSFAEKRLNASYSAAAGPGLSLRAFGSSTRANGWQDRTDYSSDRLSLSGTKTWGEASLAVALTAFRDTNLFGSPLPVDAGQPLPGFVADRNYAVDGARLDHRVYALSTELAVPLPGGLQFHNTLGITRDDQISVRSFIASADGDTATAAGVALKPRETNLFDDARLVARFQAAGTHRVVGGAALTWGRTTASGTGFDFDLTTLPTVQVPKLEEIPAGDNRSFRDRRTFIGFYLNDEWTPIPALTISAGGRYDSTSESLHVSQQEVGTAAPDVVNDSRTDGQFSGGISALWRVVNRPSGSLSVVNLYVSARSAFKPAAPNLSEAENARILDPERTRSGEIGVKTRWLDRTLSVDATLFHMIFENLVVSTVGAGGTPGLVNAGAERFQGLEVEARYMPAPIEGVAFSAGYAHHDARFIRFSFLTPDGELRVVDGKRLELVPRDLWNVGASYAPRTGPGAFVAVRHQGRRPLNRRNTFFTQGFFETDAGVSWDFSWGRFSVVGRNLGDSRHYIADSEIGDSQFYVAPPRRFSAEVAVRF
ncbi:MAG: TonB-dependent receptor [Acidobacteriota bacterium]|nr:TonB-dependent receptor [Acidobacteriota bacterium]